MTETTTPDADRANYAFDCCGYVVKQGFLSSDEIHAARGCFAELPFQPEPWNAAQRRASDIHLSMGPLKELSDRLFREPLTTQVINYPHRLLESYAFIRDHGALDLHGGASEFLTGTNVRDHSARSHVIAGRIYAARVKMLIYLDDVYTSQDGRFVYVEGSHKAEFSFHRAFPGGREEAHSLVRTLSVQAGDAIWLNEALLHGAEAKVSDSPRRVLAYTFGPSFMASWSDLTDQSLDRAGYAPAESEKPKDDPK